MAFAVALPLTHWAGAAAGADSEAGRQKAQACFACHGQAGNSTNPVVPSLAGQPRSHLTSSFELTTDSGETSRPVGVGQTDMACW